MHRLLERQIKRHFDSLEALPPEWTAFLSEVSEAYLQAEGDRHRIEQALEANAQQLTTLNSQLKAAIPDTFLRLDSQCMILDYKPGRTQRPYLPTADVLGKPLCSFLPEKVSEKFKAAIHKIVVKGTSEVSIFHELTAESALEEEEETEYFYEVRLLSLLDTQVVAIARDITERRQAEIALQQSKLKLREKTHRLATALADLKDAQTHLVQSEKMSGLGQLVAGIAHEINNPVNFVSGNIAHVQTHITELVDLLDLFLDHYPNPTPEIQERVEDIDLDFLLEDLDKIQSSMRLGVNRIKEIVLSLRVFSRLDEADMKAVDIHEGIESTLLILNHRLRQTEERSRVELTKRYGQLPLIHCYPGQLNQVFMNIIANALDAVEEFRPNAVEKSAEIIISTELRDNNHVAITIANNGPNIPYEIRDRLFDPFFTTKPVGQGTGLGLSISYQIIADRHGGRMRCYSLPGQNTEFCIEIPLEQTS